MLVSMFADRCWCLLCETLVVVFVDRCWCLLCDSLVVVFAGVCCVTRWWLCLLVFGEVVGSSLVEIGRFFIGVIDAYC